MTNFPRWSESRADIVANAGGEQAVAVARQRNQAYIDSYRLAERRKTLGLSQTEVAERMGVAKSRISQIERGEVSTIDVIARYVQALGGQIQISAVYRPGPGPLTAGQTEGGQPRSPGLGSLSRLVVVALPCWTLSPPAACLPPAMLLEASRVRQPQRATRPRVLPRDPHELPDDLTAVRREWV